MRVPKITSPIRIATKDSAAVGSEKLPVLTASTAKR